MSAADRLRQAIKALPPQARYRWHLHRDETIGDVLAGNGQHEVCVCDERVEGAYIALMDPTVAGLLADLLDEALHSALREELGKVAERLRAALAAGAPATQDGQRCGHADHDLFTNKRLRCNKPAGHDGHHGPWVVDDEPKPGWARVTLYRRSGKYYTKENWRIPESATGPYDMDRSPDFRRIDAGPVVVEAQEPWGFPHLFPGEPADL